MTVGEISLIHCNVWRRGSLPGSGVRADGVQGRLEDRRRPPPHQQRLRPWEQHWARGAASPGPQGIVIYHASFFYVIGIQSRQFSSISVPVTSINSETDHHLLHHWNKTQAHGVDMYVNGHDHCLQRISSRDRWGYIDQHIRRATWIKQLNS